MKRKVNWEKIEADYRTGFLSLRDIAAPHGITETAIRKRAKKENWQRDLQEKISGRADAIMQREIARDKQAQTGQISSNEREIIEINATTIVQIGLNHRRLAAKAREQLNKLFQEMDYCEDSLIAKSRIMQSLSGCLKSVVDTERTAWGMDKSAQETQEQVGIEISFVQPIKKEEIIINE
jgi:hypothetical protein